MNEAAITKYICDTFPNVETANDDGNTFFFPDAGRLMPFATLVTSDKYDQASNLDRPSVFRLNIGVSKATFQSVLGAPSAAAAASHDFTALDKIMPHPVYGSMFWVCVLNPGEATFPAIRTLLAEAHDRAVRKR